MVYGVHGYGRGHAMRVRAVLPALRERHEVLVFAGGDAYQSLRRDFPVLRLPTLAYRAARSGRISALQTLRHNLPLVLDLLLRGPALAMVVEALREFRPDVVVTDSEALTHWAARILRVPRISFDHFGVLVYCRPEMSWLDRWRCWGESLVYRALFGNPDRAIASAFFRAPPATDGVTVVGAVIRDEVQAVQPSRGDHLLVYLNRGQEQFTPQVEQALRGTGCPVRVYGVPREGRADNLEFKPIADRPFIEDLASCRAVLATTGNQMLGEVLHFGKPILGMPQNCLEQRLNAVQIEARGIGECLGSRPLTSELIRAFLSREADYAQNAERQERDGKLEAVEAIERYAAELCHQAALGTRQG